MASSSLKCFVPTSTDSSSLNLQNESRPSASGRGLGLCKNPQSLSMPAPTSSIDAFKSTHEGPFTSRSSKGSVICSFAIAATTAVGLSFCSFDCFAISAELEVNNMAILSVASVNSSQDPNFTLISNPSTSSNTDPDLSLSMAIPIPHEDVWVRVQNGFIAPLPYIHEHGLVMPFSQPRKIPVASEGSSLKCPQWTPSELEMVLPDFHGRPKPFPHQGRWSASFVMRGMYGEAFLQLSDSNDKVELNEFGGMDGMTTNAIEGKIKKQRMEGKLSLLKALGMEKFTCFSM